MYFAKFIDGFCGFYTEQYHGSRTISRVEIDPDSGEIIRVWEEPNPDCKIPPGAVEVSQEEHDMLLAGRNGVHVQIVEGPDGRPMLME